MRRERCEKLNESLWNSQKTGRRLNSGDSDAVDAVLLRLEAEGKIELHNVFMEDYSRNEQFALAARTDVSTAWSDENDAPTAYGPG